MFKTKQEASIQADLVKKISSAAGLLTLQCQTGREAMDVGFCPRRAPGHSGLACKAQKSVLSNEGGGPAQEGPWMGWDWHGWAWHAGWGQPGAFPPAAQQRAP